MALITITINREHRLATGGLAANWNFNEFSYTSALVYSS
jgi:hypothetical protein